MDETRTTLIKYWELLRKKTWARATAAGIPVVGAPLVQLMSARDQDELLRLFEGIADELRTELISQMRELVKSQPSEAGPVIAVGSGNGEHVVVCEGEITLGQKHRVQVDERFGGSCVNYTLRMLNCGIPALPIASIGNDALGRRIRDKLIAVAERNCRAESVLRFLSSDEFFAAGIETPRTTVLVHGSQRTIFSQPPGSSELFGRRLEERLDAADKAVNGMPGAVLIGHIYGDQMAADQADPGEPGEHTKLIVDRYAGRAPIIVNFGQTQIERGADSWQQILARVDILQLNIHEMRRLLRNGDKQRSLRQIVSWLAEHSITAVITLDRFGAIGTYKDGKRGTVFAWSLVSAEDIADPTGAGDAFAAGMATYLLGKVTPSFMDFRQGMEVGRLWAAYACTTVAGAKAYPTPRILEEFADLAERRREYKPVEDFSGFRSDELLDLIDMAYQ